ncbi:MAG: hypothetical protein NTV80_08870 [Verrucomicrobia bacterium]|nr:hypothetical protein [Verrucomicrobiota bacterium]
MKLVQTAIQLQSSCNPAAFSRQFTRALALALVIVFTTFSLKSEASDSGDHEYPFPEIPIDNANQATGEDDELNAHVEMYENTIDNLENAIENGDLEPSQELEESIEEWREAHPEDPGC